MTGNQEAGKQMTGNRKTGTARSQQRRGFTMLELLIVISIIVVLVALSIQVVGGMMANAKKAATSATISKIQGRIRDRIQSLSAVDYDQYEIIADNDHGIKKPAEKKVVSKKIVFKEAFPQTWEEFGDIDHWPDLKNEIFAEATGDPTATSNAESAEVLYYTITRAPIVGKGRRKLISGVRGVQADEFNSQDIGDTDEDGLLEFVDAWGQPLRFYRWPTRLIRPDGPLEPITDLQYANARVLISNLPVVRFNTGVSPQLAIEERPLADADDPFLAMAGSTEMTTDLFEKKFHTPSTYSIPLVVSAGPDESLGLGEPFDTNYFGRLAAMGVGPDGAPGDKNVDDDGNGTTDDMSEIGWPGTDDIDDIEAIYDNLTNHNNRPAGN